MKKIILIVLLFLCPLLTGADYCVEFPSGTPIQCYTPSSPQTETDPKVGTLTNTKWCYTDGSQVLCTQDAPAGTGDVTSVGDCTTGACFTGTTGNTLTFKGATSGTTTLAPTAIAGTTALTLPAETGTITTSVTALGGDATGTIGAVVVGDDSHAHTTTTISGIDISADTNLSGDTENVLTGDALSIGAGISRDTEWDTQGEVETVWGTTLATDTELSAHTADTSDPHGATLSQTNLTLSGIFKILESGATPTLYGIFSIADLSTADKTYTFPDSTGTVSLKEQFDTEAEFDSFLFDVESEIAAGTTAQFYRGDKSWSSTLVGTLTADGLTLGQSEYITLGTQTLNHDGIDFVFNDSVKAGGTASGQSIIDSGLVVNEGSYGVDATSDFRVESNLEDQIFIVDSSADVIRIGDFDTNYVQFTNAGVMTFVGSGDIDLPANSVDEVDLKAVDAAIDEDIFTYESTTGDFEWHTIAQMLALTTTDSLPEGATNKYNPFSTTIDDTEMTAEDFGDFTATGLEDGVTIDADAVKASDIDWGTGADQVPRRVSFVWFIEGAVATGTEQGPTFQFPEAVTVNDIELHVKTAPTGANLIVDINEAGVSIYSTRPEIDAAATTEDGNEVMSDTSIAAGAEITLDIDQVGSTVAGSDLTVILECNAPL